MVRVSITLVFILLAAAIVALSFRVGTEGSWGSLWLNLGTEILGIALTVAIVGWVFERRRVKQAARKMMWRYVHELDRVVWVWQGGRRSFDLTDMLAILDLTQPEDPVPHFTQSLLMQLGSSAQNTLRYESAVAHADHALKQALKHLTPLAKLRDEASAVSSGEIASHLEKAALHLAKGLHLDPPDARSMSDTFRDPDAKKQEWRYYGKVRDEVESDPVPVGG